MLGEVYIIPKLFKTENGGQFCIESNPVLAFNENVDVEKIDDSSSTQDEKADIYVHLSLPLSSTDEKEIQMGTWLFLFRFTIKLDSNIWRFVAVCVCVRDENDDSTLVGKPSKSIRWDKDGELQRQN